MYRWGVGGGENFSRMRKKSSKYNIGETASKSSENFLKINEFGEISIKSFLIIVMLSENQGGIVSSRNFGTPWKFFFLHRMKNFT